METSSEISEDIKLFAKTPQNFYLEDHLRYHLMSAKLECEHNSDAFWRMYRMLKRRCNLLSVPLLVLSSATGVTSVSAVSQLNQLNQLAKTFEVAPILAAIFGVSTAVLSGLQKYFRYSERAENCKYIAKSYNRLAKRIKNTMSFIHSELMKITPNGLYKFIDEINKEIISLTREIDEQPIELIKPRAEHVKVMQDLKNFYVKNHQMKEGDITLNIPSTLAEIEI